MRSFHAIRKLTLLTAGIGLFAAGCASNPYERFYTPVGAPRAMTEKAAAPPEVLRGSNQEADTLAMLENGYFLIGYSSFRGRAADIQQAVAYGQKIGAAAVVSYSRYPSTTAESIPLVLPNSQARSMSSTLGSVTGSGGDAISPAASDGGSSTFRSPGPAPSPIDPYDQAAGYFVKAGKSVLGLFARDLNPEECSRLERSRGVVAFAIMKESPAARGQFARGDILIEFAGEPIESQAQFSPLVLRHCGENVTVKVLREGSIRELQVQLNQPSPQVRSRRIQTSGSGSYQEIQEFPQAARESHCHLASSPD